MLLSSNYWDMLEVVAYPWKRDCHQNNRSRIVFFTFFFQFGSIYLSIYLLFSFSLLHFKWIHFKVKKEWIKYKSKKQLRLYRIKSNNKKEQKKRKQKWSKGWREGRNSESLSIYLSLSISIILILFFPISTFSPKWTILDCLLFSFR